MDRWEAKAVAEALPQEVRTYIITSAFRTIGDVFAEGPDISTTRGEVASAVRDRANMTDQAVWPTPTTDPGVEARAAAVQAVAEQLATHARAAIDEERASR